MFKKINEEYNINKLEEKIGNAGIGYFIKIIHTMKSTNEIDLTILELPEGTLNRIRAKFIKEGIIGKFKLDGVSKYYLNPFYAHQGKGVSKELYNSFNEINDNKIY